MKYRDHLPQLDGDLFTSDGGIETTLIFHEGLDLPLFAAFALLNDEEGTDAMRRYFEPFAEIAANSGTGFILESPTWRASPRWATELGYSTEDLDGLNRKAIALMEEIRRRYESPDTPIVISGCIGPQDDGYNPQGRLSATEAEDYHSTQINTFADTAADMVNAMTMTYSDEAIGVARAAAKAGMPAAIHFTVETDGRLPSEEPLGEAIAAVVDATGDGPAYFGINCAHPTHFDDALESAGEWRERIRGLRANASTKSHAELDEATELDAGDPADLGARYAALRDRLPNLNVVGGCCGTDQRHVEEIAEAILSG
ncbi:MAG TPA: homocysteine S-methyltransferase family protein [Thermoanaerobaculia bacterium]|nr:homocysteine S-methyltransferase family protein [Thermoanaerobaculia bacterium]